jgi:phosphomannomutase
MADLDAIFKAYDVRGTVPDQLDAPTARAIGAAFAAFTGGGRVVVARDMRPSGVELSQAFEAGAQQAGSTVTDLGLASTDLLYYASGLLDAPGAMFTASHNPAAYNGIKMCLAGARPIGQDTGLARIKELAAESLASGVADRGLATGVGQHGVDQHGVEQLDLLDSYAAHVRSFVDIGRLRPLRVVADTANGMGGLVAPRVLDPLPFEVEIIVPELDGSFPNHPADPIQPENLEDLRGRVTATGADVGLAFDGDADRVFLVDEKGEPLSGSLTTAMVAAAMLGKHPGATIIYNLICSKAVPEIIRENGGTPVRTRVGHSFIKTVMAETGAVFGGEHSGHYYFRDNYRADSGLIAALVVLEMLSVSEAPLSEMRRPFERYADSGEINTAVADPVGVLEAVEKHYAGSSIDHTDGLTVDLGEWWFNLRSSNTEPLLRLNLEAPDEASCHRHVDEVRALMAAADTRRPESEI